MDEPAVILGIVAVGMALVKILEVVVKSLLKKTSEKEGSLSSWTEEEKDIVLSLIQRLYDMHNKVDGDGTPIWYVPRSWADTQKEILSMVSDLASTQALLAQTMERCVEILDRIDRRHD